MKKIPRFHSERSYVIEYENRENDIHFILKESPRDVLVTDLKASHFYIDDKKYKVEKVNISPDIGHLIGLDKIHVITKHIV